MFINNIVKRLPIIMDIQQKLDDLETSVKAEKAQVAEKMGAMQSEIDALKVQVANGALSQDDLLAAIARIESIKTEVESIVE